MCAWLSRRTWCACEAVDQRLGDIDTAITAIPAHLARGDLSDGLVFDSVRRRLLEIGEAVKAISPSLVATELGIPWKNIAAMRDQLAHRYFDTEHPSSSERSLTTSSPYSPPYTGSRPESRPTSNNALHSDSPACQLGPAGACCYPLHALQMSASARSAADAIAPASRLRPQNCSP